MKYLIGILILGIVVLIFGIFNIPDNNFHIIACDIGQGDGILITYKSFQILTDGGPNDNKILNCLARHMPFWDKEIEVVILTNPDLDHYGGLIQVFKNYKVDNYFKSAVDDSTESFRLLEKVVGSSRVSVHEPTPSTSIRSGLMSLDIIYPDDGAKNINKDVQNNNSTVTLLTYGNFKALLTGDAETEASDYIAQNLGLGKVNYLKVNHHGSKNGLSSSLLETINPQIAAISVGKNNRYGHPSPETLKMLESHGIKYYRTDEHGDIEVISDGNKYWLRN